MPQHRVLTHAGNDLVSIDTRGSAVTGRWPTGCSGTHGFPQIDTAGEHALASCADGNVALLDAATGAQRARIKVGGGRSLPAYSLRTDHFYARTDPGTHVVRLAVDGNALHDLGQVTVPKTGHCLTADTLGHYWTCDADNAHILRFNDS